MFSPTFTRPITVVTPGEHTDRYGNVTKDWTNSTRTDTAGWVGAFSGFEYGADQGREAAFQTWTVYLPTGVTVSQEDRIETGTDTFEVDGPVVELWSPRGGHHLEARIRKVDG